MSGLLTGTAFTNQFTEINTTTGNGSDTLQGLVVAIYEIGCFAGSLFCLFAGESLGRKNCIWLGCLILSIGAALQTTAYGIPQMIVGRIVAGVGNGMNTSTIRELKTCAESGSRSTLTRSSCVACGAHASPQARKRLINRVCHQHLRRSLSILGRLWLFVRPERSSIPLPVSLTNPLCRSDGVQPFVLAGVTSMVG
jgi:MFS family permease